MPEVRVPIERLPHALDLPLPGYATPVPPGSICLRRCRSP